MKKKFFLLICIFMTTFFLSAISIHATSNLKWTKEDCENLIKFISNHFNEFVEQYNLQSSDDLKLSASSIEYHTLLWLIEDENYGVYLDFNDDNGYAVFTGDKTIYELKNQGDFTDLRNQTIYYSYVDGLMYLDQNYDFQIVSRPIHSLSTTSGTIGETIDGDIGTTKIDEYVMSNYPNYSLECKVEPISKNFDYSQQKNTSYYVVFKMDENGNTDQKEGVSEGNCSTNSCFALLREWQRENYLSNLPETNINRRNDIQQDPLYEEYGQGIIRKVTEEEKKLKIIEGDYCKWVTNDKNLLTMPVLYDEIRTIAIEKYNFTPISGLYDDQIMDIMYTIAKNYGNSIQLKQTNSVSTALKEIDNGRACYLSINGSLTYFDHAMVLLGYHKYSYESGWWIFKTKSYAYFFEVADGWQNFSSRFFNPNLSENLTMNFIYLS